MVSIPLNEGTVTLTHEWPVNVRTEKYQDGEPVVSLEVDTDLGTAVVALGFGDLVELAAHIDGLLGYYDTIEEDEWSSR